METNKKFRHLADGIYILETPFCGAWSGVFLIDRESRRILIDSGADAATVDGCIVPALAERGMKPDDLDLLLCTHSHGDHIGGHFHMKELAPNVKAVVFEGSLSKLRNPLKYSKLIRARFPNQSPPPPAVLRGIEPDVILKDGDELDAGSGALRLVHAPGHDDDAVCFYDVATKSLIAGDSLQGDGTSLQGIGFYQSLPAYRDSLRKLLKLDIETLASGHDYVPFGPMAFCRDGARKILEGCLDLTYQYDGILDDALELGIRGLETLTKRLIARRGGTPPNRLFLALYTTSEHLKLKFGKDWNDRVG